MLILLLAVGAALVFAARMGSAVVASAVADRGKLIVELDLLLAGFDRELRAALAQWDSDRGFVERAGTALGLAVGAAVGMATGSYQTAIKTGAKVDAAVRGTGTPPASVTQWIPVTESRVARIYALEDLLGIERTLDYEQVHAMLVQDPAWADALARRQHEWNVQIEANRAAQPALIAIAERADWRSTLAAQTAGRIDRGLQ